MCLLQMATLSCFLLCSANSSALKVAFGMQVVEQLVKQLDTKKKELTDLQEKYKIRIRVGKGCSA